LPEIESAVIRVVAEVSKQLAPQLAGELEFRQASVTTAATDALLSDLGRGASALLTYLESPGFAAVVTQCRVGKLGGKAAKDQLYHGLRLAGVAEDLLARTADIVHDVMTDACQEAAPQFAGASPRIDGSDLYRAAVNNSLMLRRLRSATRIHAFAARMRDQVAALHSRIRLPHAGVSRSVRYEQLYVAPTLTGSSVTRLGAPGERVLVLGDPGAGKSTLAAKFAHDVAVDGSGRVPFLMVLREFTTAFDEGGHDLLHHLEKLCQAPYNVQPPRDGVEYLLRTGRAVVVLDGLDELVQTESRRRVVSLVEGFAHLYPLVPILVTARKVGYEDAPLSDDLFVISRIAEFSDKQVTDYATRWFLLDEATSPVERERLAGAFLRDSERIPELRSNPLLLTLLCAMYSSDRYLPRNMAQVYERCALMLFEQWDAKRGIDLPLSFEGRLRGAVQHLAWNMFTAAESGKPQARTRIVRMLTDYLEAKLDDHDESVATAERFLSYCTGRAWILSDVGANRSEPLFGFTHRTFMEYFAAEHLVRTHRTAEQLWAVLRMNARQWDVVAQIALQLYDRNVEGGVDELLLEALDNDGLEFAARALHFVHPATRTVRAIATAAVDVAARTEITSRLDVSSTADFVDEPLNSCMFSSSEVNRPVIERAVAERLGEFVRNGELGAALLLHTMVNPKHSPHDRWQQVQQELTREHHERLVELWKDSPWATSTFGPEVLAEIVRRSGVLSLYVDYWCNRGVFDSIADELLPSDDTKIPESDLAAIAMTEVPTPWGNRTMFMHLDWEDHYEDYEDALRMMLTLPMLEERYTDADSRKLPRAWFGHNLPPEVRQFLVRWMRGEVSVLAPAPGSLPPPPEEH
jgi:hypothetical protein